MNIDVDVRSPDALRAALEDLLEGREVWTSPVGLAVLGRIELMARWALGRTPVVVWDPHLVTSTVSHVWERLTTGQARFVIQAERPDRLLRSMVARTLVQVARAGAVCGSEPSATHRGTPRGEVPSRLGDRTGILEASGAAVEQSPVVNEMATAVRMAVVKSSLLTGSGVMLAEQRGLRAADALRYIVDEVAAGGIAMAYRRLSQDEQLEELLPWWSARALVWAVTGTKSGQCSWQAARSSVFARLHAARSIDDERSIAEIAPEWSTIVARVTAAFRADLTVPEFSAWEGVDEQLPLPGLAVVV